MSEAKILAARRATEAEGLPEGEGGPRRRIGILSFAVLRDARPNRGLVEL